jgi:predicted ester cyclase
MSEERSTSVTTEENKALIRRLMEQANSKGNLDVVDELVAPDYVLHTPASPTGEVHGTEDYKQLISMQRSAAPDLIFMVEDQIAEGQKVVTRYSARGTHQGEFMGSAPTGKQANTTGIVISRIAGGKIAEEWLEWDVLGLMHQLGAISEPVQASR